MTLLANDTICCSRKYVREYIGQHRKRRTRDDCTNPINLVHNLAGLLPPCQTCNVDRRREAPESDSKDTSIDRSSDVESSSPAHGFAQDTAENKTDGKAYGLATTHRCECDIASSAGEGARDDAYSAGEAEREGHSTEGPKEDHLRSCAGETTAEHETGLKDTAREIHDAATHCICEGAGKEEGATTC